MFLCDIRWPWNRVLRSCGELRKLWWNQQGLWAKKICWSAADNSFSSSLFILLRSYAGGIHAKTEMACTIWTTLAMGTATVTIKVLKASNAKLPLCFLLCNVCLLAFSPLGNRGKPLDASERYRYRKVCIGLIVAFDMVAIIANFIVIPTFYYPVICGMCLEAILLCIGKICNM